MGRLYDRHSLAFLILLIQQMGLIADVYLAVYISTMQPEKHQIGPGRLTRHLIRQFPIANVSRRLAATSLKPINGIGMPGVPYYSSLEADLIDLNVANHESSQETRRLLPQHLIFRPSQRDLATAEPSDYALP